MFDGKELNQSGGDGSRNQQALKIKNVYKNYGPTEAQLLESQIEVFRKNIPILAQAAADLMAERALEFSEKLIIEKLAHKPELLGSFKDPGMQMAAYEAQKHYAKSGDIKMADLLLDFLAARAENNERNLLQIAFDECLSIIPKLTTPLLDKLTALFLVNQGLAGIKSFYELKQYLTRSLHPIISSISENLHQYSYLQYLNCVEQLDEVRAFTDMLITKRARLFYPGIPLDEFERSYGFIEQYAGFIDPCPYNPEVIKYSWDDFLSVNNIFGNESIDINIRGAVTGINGDLRMDVNSRGEELLMIPVIEKAQKLWLSSRMSKLTTTHVGALIGQAHLKNYTGIDTEQILLG